VAITKSDVRTAFLADVNSRTTIYDPNTGYGVFLFFVNAKENLAIFKQIRDQLGINHVWYLSGAEDVDTRVLILCNQTAADQINSLVSDTDVQIKSKLIPYYTILFTNINREEIIFFAYEGDPNTVEFKLFDPYDLV